VYHSPADLENLIKEAALIATRYKREEVTHKDLSEALERIDLGFKIKTKLAPEERTRVAYHETGHLITTFLLHPTDDVFKASIISRRGGTHGVVYHVPREELKLNNRDRMLANVKVALAGYVAEKIKCGSTSDGCGSDFGQAMNSVRRMVWNYGMGSNGFIGNYEMLTGSWAFRQGSTGDFLSDRVKEKLNDEMHVLLKQCLEDVDRLLRQEDALFERFKDELLKKDELEFDEIEAIFREYGKTRPAPSLTAGTS
jgi:cell division protease FtsH